MPTWRLPAERHLLRRASGPAPRPTGSRPAAARPGSGSWRRRRNRPPAPCSARRRGSRAASRRRYAVIGPHLARDALAVVERARLVDQHDRDAVADRVGQASLLADQLVASAVVAQRRPWSAGRPAAPAAAGRGPASPIGSVIAVSSGNRRLHQWRALEPPGSASAPSPSARSAAAPGASRRRPRAVPASPPARTGRSCTAR